MDALLAKLSEVPVRRDSVLDVPLSKFVAQVRSHLVANLLSAYGVRRRRATLREVIADPQLKQFAKLQADTRVGKALRRELEAVVRVTAEEYMLDDDDEPPRAPRNEALRAWAAAAGVAARLSDPASAIAPSVRDYNVSRALRHDRDATVGDLVDGVPLDGGGYDDRHLVAAVPALRALGEAYVRKAGERAIARREREARLARLAPALADEPRAFLEALDAAIARVSSRAKARALGDFDVVHVELVADPFRVVVSATLPAHRNGKARERVAWLALDGWRTTLVESLIDGQKGEARTAEVTMLVLREVRDVMRDPAHPAHAPLVAHLSESAWSRVLRSVDVALAGWQRDDQTTAVAWRVVRDRGGVRLTALVTEIYRNGDRVERECPAESLSRDDKLAPKDQAAARALSGQTSSFYSYVSEDEKLDRVFRALLLLEGHDRVRGKGDVPCRVASGRLGVALERDGDGWRLAFDIAGERLDASDLRAAIDRLGRLIHVDPARGQILLARLGERERQLVAALASEAATFPTETAGALADKLTAIAGTLPMTLPDALAGEQVEADPRPLARLERDGVDALWVKWLVRPIPGGPTFPPGEGTPKVVRALAGEPRVFAKRELAEERRRLDALRESLSSALPVDASTTTRCTGLESVLAVVELLRVAAATGDVSVEWPQVPLPRVVGKADWSKLRFRVTAGRDWFGMDGAAEVDGVTIALADLLEARRKGQRFVAVGPNALVALEDDLRARLGELDALARPAKSGLAIARAVAPMLGDLLRSDDSGERVDAAAAFWTLLERVDAARASEPKLPRGFAKVLRAYQVDGFRWMSRLAAWGAGACLADDMGLGKTVQALALLVSRQAQGPALVVAPTSVGPNWLHEAARFAPSLKPLLYRGAGRESALARLGPSDLVVTSYDLLARDADALARIEFATVVMDEAQAIKNGDTTRARAARALRADFRLALTGTPVENRLAELHSLMEFLNPGFFGTTEEFRARYVVPIERDRDAAQSAALAKVVRPFLLRRKKAAVLSELPARTEVTRAVERTPAERRLYDAARALAIRALTSGDEDARFRILAEIMRLRRLACHPRLEDDASTVPSSKLEAFLTLVGELREDGHRALVFSQFTGHLALVEEALRARAIPYVYLDGKTPLAERTRRVAAFQAGEGDLFLISLKAGGTGLNLTAADTVIHLDPWWNPAVEDQATDRAHRIGQKRPVTVVRLVAQGTIEEAVMSLHAEKRELAESILEGTAASGKLSIAELGALIREGATA